jgi:hypothetical protein
MKIGWRLSPQMERAIKLKAESAAVDFDFEFKKPVIHIVANSSVEFGSKV